MNDPMAIPSLQNALRDPDKYVRYGAASALRKMGWNPASAEEQAFLQVGMQEWEAVREIGVPAIPALSHVLHDRDSGVRMQAIDILGSIGHEKAIPAFIRSLADENPDVRWRTVMASPKCGVSMLHLPRGLAAATYTKKSTDCRIFKFHAPGPG